MSPKGINRYERQGSSKTGYMQRADLSGPTFPVAVESAVSCYRQLLLPAHRSCPLSSDLTCAENLNMPLWEMIPGFTAVHLLLTCKAYHKMLML